MTESYILQNEDRILRPVTIDDAEFIVKLRNQNHAKGFIHDTSSNVEKQKEWLRCYFERENEYYWIVTTLDGVPYGTISLYNYDEQKNQIESGRWVRLPGFENNMISGHVQMRDFVFTILGLDRIVCDVVSSNAKVLKFHKRILREKQLDKIDVIDDVGGNKVEVLWFEETRQDWQVNRPHFLELCGDMTTWKLFKKNLSGEYVEI